MSLLLMQLKSWLLFFILFFCFVSGCAYFSPPTTIIFLVFLIFEGLLFGLFTLIMFCTQINSVINDETVSWKHFKDVFQEFLRKSGSVDFQEIIWVPPVGLHFSQKNNYHTSCVSAISHKCLQITILFLNLNKTEVSLLLSQKLRF